MMMFSIDITPWAVVVTALGVLFGTLFKKPLYGVFATLAIFFGAYSLLPIFGMPYSIFVMFSWLLSVLFAASSVSNLFVAWVRRIEMQLRTLVEEMETLRLMVEGK